MANISGTLEQDLKDNGYTSYTLHDDNDFSNDNPKMENVTSMTIYAYEPYFIMKTFRLPKKKLVDINYCLDKLNADSVYKNFTEEFKTILEDNGIKNSINAYPTSYGIGVFVLFNFRNETTELKNQIDNILNDLGIEFKNEHSDAGWVFRYKISKSKGNIEKLKTV